MLAVHLSPPGPTVNRGVLLTGVLLASAIVMAQESPGLQAPPGSQKFLSDELYEEAGGWREKSITGSEWRAPPTPQKRSRINFGYDSVHEEQRARDDADSYSGTGLNLRGTQKSNTQLQLRF